MTSCRRVAMAINDVLDTMPDHVVIDLRHVELVDSTAVAVLVHANRRARRHRIEMRFLCETPSTVKVLRLAGLSHACGTRGGSRTTATRLARAELRHASDLRVDVLIPERDRPRPVHP